MVHFYAPARKGVDYQSAVMVAVSVSLDIASLVIQLIEGGIGSPSASEATAIKGNHIYVGGIGMQELYSCCFLVLEIKFHRDMLQADGDRSCSRSMPICLPLPFISSSDFLHIPVKRACQILSSIMKDTFMDSTVFPYSSRSFLGTSFILAFFLKDVDSKLPPDWLRRKMCGGCGCCGRRKAKETHQPLSDNREEIRPSMYAFSSDRGRE